MKIINRFFLKQNKNNKKVFQIIKKQLLSENKSNSTLKISSSNSKSKSEKEFNSKKIIQKLIENNKDEDTIHQLALSIEILKNIQNENDAYLYSFSSEMNKILIENKIKYSKDMNNNYYLTKHIKEYTIIIKFKSLEPRINHNLENTLNDHEYEEDLYKFNKNNLYETGGEVLHRDQTEWFIDPNAVNSNERLEKEMLIDSRIFEYDMYLINTHKQIIHFEMNFFNSQVIVRYIRIYNNTSFSKVMELESSIEDQFLYKVEFDSLNIKLQNSFCAYLEDIQIIQLSKVARYIAINREHFEYIDFLEKAFNTLI